MLSVLFSTCLFLTISVEAATLKESFEAALKNMESIKRAEQTVFQREEQKSRVKAAVLPTVSGFSTYTRIDPPSAAGPSPFLLTRQYNSGLRLTQPLIRGGVVGAIELANENLLLAKFQKDATDLNLYQLVINAYYNLKIAQSDVKNLEKFLSYSRERVSEIRSRTKIGRSRRGELVEAEAQLHNFESQYQQGRIALQEAEKNYEFLTRMTPGPIPDLPAVPKVDGSLESYLAKLKDRPDLLAVKQQVAAADRQIAIAKGGHFPSVDLIGNYYFERTGILASSKWDAGVVVSFPIYQGGAVLAATREAVAGKRIAELTTQEAVRTAERELSILFENYKQLHAQLDAVKLALEKSEEAYRLNKKDYGFGLVTNLDVLVSLNSFIQNKRSYDSLFALTHMTYKNLEAAIGVLP